MNVEEAYLSRVRAGLGGMDSRVKEDIIRELKTHIADLVRINNGNVNVAMTQLEPPNIVARRYKELYGYATPFKGLFVVLAGVLAVLTLPVLQIGGEEVTIPLLVSLVFLTILVLLLIFTGMKAGMVVGFVAGLVACVIRLALFGVLFLIGGENVFIEAGGASLFVVVSVLLVLIGYLPGEAKAKWVKPSGEM